VTNTQAVINIKSKPISHVRVKKKTWNYILSKILTKIYTEKEKIKKYHFYVTFLLFVRQRKNMEQNFEYLYIIFKDFN